MDAREAMPVPAGPLVGSGGGDAADLPGRARHAGAAGPAEGRRVAARRPACPRASASRRCSSAKALGASVIGTSGSPEKLARLARPRPRRRASRRARPDFAAAVMEATGGRGADLVVNTVGGSVFAECVRSHGVRGPARDRRLRRRRAAGRDRPRRRCTRSGLTLFGVSNKLRNAEQRAAGVPAFVADCAAG